MIYRGKNIVLLYLAITCSLSYASGFTASAWPEADSLFRGDAHWVGADDAYSVDLGQGRILWLFADTLIDPTGHHQRNEAVMIHNSVGIQQGSNPAHASISFFWKRSSKGGPASFFEEDGQDYFWPGDGILVKGRLFVFLMRVRPSDKGLGFEVFDWDVVRVDHPDMPASEWHFDRLDTPHNDFGVIVGSSSVLRSGDFVYAFGSREPGGPHSMYLVRWPVKAFAQGALDGIQWWKGENMGWVSRSDLQGRPEPVFKNGQTELTVHFDCREGRYRCIQGIGFGAAPIGSRTAEALTGPWTNPCVICRPPEMTLPHIMIYAVKEHPELTGADVVITYATNSLNFADLKRNPSLYYPRFVRLSRKR